MKIGMRWDDRELLLSLRNGQRKLAYATANAINTAAKRIQQDEFAHVRATFVIREERVFFGSDSRPGGVAGKIIQFAKPLGSLEAVLAVGERATYSKRGDDHKRGFLLAGFEKGATRTPTYGARALAVPITGGARPDKRSKIDRQLSFSGLQLKAYEYGKKVKGPGKHPSRGIGVFGEYGRLQPPGGSKEERIAFGLPVRQYKGKHRAFLLTQSKAFPHGAVFQRTGKERGDIRVLWKFQPEIKIDARLHYVSLARVRWAQYFREAMEHEVILALAHESFRDASGRDVRLAA